MSDEIKEMLDNLEDAGFMYKRISPEEIKKILDYITNLQEAIEIKNQRINEEQQEKERYIKFYNELNIWNKQLQEENKRLNNIINELEWKPIEQYEKPKYDWVLVKYYIEPEFECIPTVAEERFGKWYDRNDNEIIGEVRYFMDMQLLDKLKELKENK